jgi:hypothetical protein
LLLEQIPVPDLLPRVCCDPCAHDLSAHVRLRPPVLACPHGFLEPPRGNRLVLDIYQRNGNGIPPITSLSLKSRFGLSHDRCDS